MYRFLSGRPEGLANDAFKRAARSAAAWPLIVNATPGETRAKRGDTALATLTTLRNELTGKILLDVPNATTRLPNGMPGGLLYPGSSLAEQLQSALPDTHVVEALNKMLFSVMAAHAKFVNARSSIFDASQTPAGYGV
jgi:8-hydroxy-5-deazaflavin:NADPH oxidoreductase